jgi:hypothetical protein
VHAIARLIKGSLVLTPGDAAAAATRVALFVPETLSVLVVAAAPGRSRHVREFALFACAALLSTGGRAGPALVTECVYWKTDREKERVCLC